RSARTASARAARSLEPGAHRRAAHGRTPLQRGPDARGACGAGPKRPKLQGLKGAFCAPAPTHSPESMSQTPTTPRPSVMQLAIKEKAALYAAYIPIFANGGIFVPTPREYRLGDDVYVLLTLPEDPRRYPIAGKVAWVTPARAAGNRTQGVGIQFPKDDKSRQLRQKIEEILGSSLGSDRATQTI